LDFEESAYLRGIMTGSDEGSKPRQNRQMDRKDSPFGSLKRRHQHEQNLEAHRDFQREERSPKDEFGQIWPKRKK
jgi:hypothetical protein